MKSLITRISISAILTAIVGYSWWYIFVPAINIFDYGFLWLLSVMAIVFFTCMALSADDDDSAKSIAGWSIAGLVGFFVVMFMILPFFGSEFVRAKDYSKIISVKTKDFNKDFPESNVDQLALLSKTSAKNIGNSYLGTIDKVSQFNVSDEYRQITIDKKPYRVSPLEYASMIRWYNNRENGIQYYIKVNQTTGKTELVHLKKGMRYTASSYFGDDVMRKLRRNYMTTLFKDPSFEVDDEGNPWYVATTYKRKFGFGPLDPNGVILLDPISGNSKFYKLKDVPKWVDRVYSASDVIDRINWHYGYANGFWNTVFSKSNIKKTTVDYGDDSAEDSTYISIGDDIYLYTGLTSINSDSSNLGFVLTNLRTRETVFYPLPSATEKRARKSAEGAVQEKKYDANSPILVKLNGQSYYLSSLEDNGNLVKAYALVNAEDFQQVKVSSDIKDLIAQVTTKSADQKTSKDSKGLSEISGQISDIKTQVVDGTTIYYVKVNDTIYKIKADADTLDQLPFIAVGQTITANLKDNNYLQDVNLQ